MIRVLNSKFMIKIPHRVRIMIVATCMVTGFSTLTFGALSDDAWRFWVCILATIIIGWSGSLGESVNLGFLKAFPSKLILGWSSGTGFAGVLGAGISLLFATLNVYLPIVLQSILLLIILLSSLM
jgi:battenin